MSVILINSSFERGQLPVASGCYLSTRMIAENPYGEPEYHLFVSRIAHQVKRNVQQAETA